MQTPWNPGDKYPEITITMADGGVITAELYPDKAPNSVCNFLYIAQSGYYTGKVFHRAIPGFMIQGGSPGGDGVSTGFPYTIKGEFAGNGFAQNDIKHTPGILSMARTNYPDSGSTQFFIMHGTSPWLDGNYAAFGKVLTGMDVVERIVNSPRNGELLAAPAVIDSVTVDTFGLEYPQPEKLAA